MTTATQSRHELLRTTPVPFAKPAAEQDLPARLVFLPWGKSESVSKGDFIVNETTAGLLPVNQERSNRQRVAIDFSHNSVEGSPFYQGEPVTLAGYADAEVIPGEGLVFSNIAWTPAGLKHAHDYQELSAAVLTNERGEVIWCHSGALCRHGQVAGRKLHTLSAHALACLAFSTQTNPTTTMDYKTLLTLILGLPADADDAAIQTAAESYAKKQEAQATELKTLSTTLADVQKKLAGAPAEGALAALAQRLETLEKAHEQAQREAITTQAIAQGKIIPLSADKLPLEDFRAIVKDLPADQVPLHQRTPEQIKTLASTGMGAPAADTAAEICRQMGISKEQWDKHNAWSPSTIIHSPLTISH